MNRLNQSSIESNWVIKASFKFDVGSFSNLFTKNELIIEKHREAYQRFEDQINAREDLLELASTLFGYGFNPGMVLNSVFDYSDYNGYEILPLIDDEDLWNHDLKKYFVEDAKLVTEEAYNAVYQFKDGLIELVKYILEIGFLDYWKEEVLPDIKEKGLEFGEIFSNYNVIGAVNKLLGEGYHLKSNQLTVYLSKFAAPYGTSLQDDSFLTDISWDYKDTISVAIHELIHPPFEREYIGQLADKLEDDELFLKAFNSQGELAAYNTPLRFLEENIVEGAHIYLAHQLGVVEDPLQYFIEHDDGTHVVSVIIYNALMNGIREEVSSMRGVVERLVEDQILVSGNIKPLYEEIYKSADLADENPYI